LRIVGQAGDESAIVTAEQGIVPLEGTRMLRFISSRNLTSSGSASDIWQLVDVTPYGVALGAGSAHVTFSAAFNRISGDGETEPQVYVSVRAYAGLTGEFPLVAETPLAGQDVFFLSDGDPSSWECVSASVLVPAGTTYLGVRVAARETLDNSPPPEFAGHYADDTVLEIQTVPEPASWLLLATGWSAVPAMRRRARRGRRGGRLAVGRSVV
jgi:hypothetical protein